MVEIKTYACSKCGHPFAAVPPDDIHVVVLLEPCKKGDSVEIPYDCKNCDNMNTRYWDKIHKLDEFDRISIS